MSTNIRHYESTHPGQEGTALAHNMHFSPVSLQTGQYAGGFFPSNMLAELFGKSLFTSVGGNQLYQSGGWTVTTTGTGAAAAQAITKGGGVKLTAGSSSTFNTNLQSIMSWTAVVNKNVAVLARLQTSDITTVGFELSIGTSAVDPGSTNYTDCVKIKMAVGAGTMVGSVRGNTLTQSNSGTLNTAVAATDFIAGFYFNCGVPKAASTATTLGTGTSSATQTVGSTSGMQPGDVLYFATSAAYRGVASITNATTVVLTATLSTTTGEAVTVFGGGGGFFTGANIDALTYTPFSEAQRVQMSAIAGQATPAVMYLNLHAKGSAGNPSVTFASATGNVDY